MRHARTAAIAAALIVITVMTIAACSSSKKSSSTASGSAASTPPASTGASSASTISIKSFAFNPGSVTVGPGATVTVSNGDQTDHTVTADDKSFDTHHVSGSKSATFTAPTKPGTYRYHCDIHNYMTGTLIVR